MAQDTSIREFIASMREAQDILTKNIMRFQLTLGQKIQKQTQANILEIFGAGGSGGGVGRSIITTRAWGNTATSSGRSGALFRSVALEASGGDVMVSVGGVGVPYAQLQEEGGEIVPVNAKMLTLPFNPKTYGHRAKEFHLLYDVDPRWGPVLRFAEYGRGPKRNSANMDESIAYLLRLRSKIPARPFFVPAIEKVSTDQTVRDLMRQMIGRDDLKMEIS